MATYTDTEINISNYVIDKIQKMLDDYFGTNESSCELTTRNIALYERKTFVNLINMHIYRIILSREEELVNLGRNCFTNQEFKNIYTKVNYISKRWLNQYDEWVRNNPSYTVSDITAKKSKAIKFIDMSEINWAKLRNTIDTEADKIRRGYNLKKKRLLATTRSNSNSILVYNDYINNDELSSLKNKYPTKNFVSKSEVTDGLTNNVLNEINNEYNYETPFFNAYVNRSVNTMEQESNSFIRNNGVDNAQTRTTENKHQNYVNYVTQQLLSEDNPIFGLDSKNSNTQNVYVSLKNNSQPSLSDFSNFVTAKAVSEAYRGGNSSYGNDNNYKYTEYDIDKVIKENKTYAKEIVIPSYEKILRDNGLSSEFVGDKETGKAFGINIPEEKQIKQVYEAIKDEVEASGLMDIDRQLTTNDKEDIANRIEEIARKQNPDVDPEFLEPLVASASSAVISANETKNNVKNNDTTLRERNVSTRENNTREKSTSKLDAMKAKSTTARHSAKMEGVASLFAPTYRTFSGHDMVVTVELPLSSNYRITKVIGAFQTVTYSIHNGKSPIRVLGDMNVRRYVVGPRTIAGTLILTVFDRHWIKELLGSYKKIKSETERYFLADELPSFNMTISCTNEYGHDAKLAIYGVTLVDEGQVMSINDVYTENTYTFFATSVEYLDRVADTSSNKKSSPINNLPTKPDSTTPTGDSQTGNQNPEKTESGKTKEDIFKSKYIYDKQGALNKLKEIDKEGKDDFNKSIDDLIDKYNNKEITDEKFTIKLADIMNKESKREKKLWEKNITNSAIKDIKNSKEDEDTKKWQQNSIKENSVQVNTYIEENNTKLANEKVNSKLNKNKEKEDKT